MVLKKNHYDSLADLRQAFLPGQDFPVPTLLLHDTVPTRHNLNIVSNDRATNASDHNI